MMQADKVTLFDLPSPILKPASRKRSSSPQQWQQAREEFERHFILEKLVENKGNVSRTATAIGMERTHLHRKMKAYAIKVK